MGYFNDVMRILNDSVESLDATQFRKLVNQCKETLAGGNQIIVTGLGKNVPICDKFVGTMLSLGLRASFLHTNSAVHGDLGIVHSGDLVIVLTKSGETKESIYLVEKLKERKVELWLLTFSKESTLTNRIDNCIVLELEHEGDKWNIMPNNSTTMNLIVLQGIAMHLAEEMEVGLDDFKRNHPGGHIGKELSDR